MEDVKKRILVIDDDPSIHAALEITFTNAGFEYAQAQTAADGLRALKSSRFDLVVVDGLLPDKSGVTLCDNIRSLPEYKGLKIIFYSAFFKKAAFFKRLKSELGVDLVLHKPLEPAELLRRAVELIGVQVEHELQTEENPFADLVNEFNNSFLNRLEAIEALIDKIASGEPPEPPLKGLLFITHKLHGTSAIFGHPLVGESAAIWEEELDKIIESSTPVTERTIEKFRFYFEWLKLNFQTPAQEQERELEIQQLEDKTQPALEEKVAPADKPLRQDTAAPDEKAISEKQAASVEENVIVIENASIAEASAVEINGPDILIVDDDPVVRRLVSYALGLRGYSYENIEDGDIARARIFSDDRPLLPRIILLDVNLPGVDGFTLLREIKESPYTNEVKVIMLSSHGREDDLLRGFESGATDFVIKPFSVPILVHRIRIALSTNYRDSRA